MLGRLRWMAMGITNEKKRGNKLVRKEIEIIFKLLILNVFGGNY